MSRWSMVSPASPTAQQITAAFTNCGRAPMIEITSNCSPSHAAAMPLPLRVECLDGPADLLDIFRRKFGVDWHRQCLGRGLFAERQVAGVIAQVRKARLQVQGQRIINLGSDAVLLQIRLQGVALPAADGELVVDVTRRERRGLWRNHRNLKLRSEE